MASGINLKSTNNSEMNIVYQGTSGATRTVVVPDKDMTVGSEITLGTAQATTSGTYKDFAIPSGVKRVTVMFDGVSTSGTSALLIQLGDSGGIENTGYSSTSCNIGGTPSTTSSTIGFLCNYASAASNTNFGKSEICLTGGYSFVFGSTVGQGVNPSVGSGAKTLSSELTTVRITTVNGTDTFDAGTVNVSWEY